MPEGTDQGGNDQQQSQQAPPQGDPPKTFTQEQMDAIIADRLQRERTKFVDYDALKEKAAAFDAAEAAKQTETERAQKAKEEAERRAIEVQARANATLKRAAILAEAGVQNSADPDTVAMILANSEDIVVADDGTVTGAKEAVKKLLKEKAFLVKAPAGGATGAEFGGNDGELGIDAKIAQAEQKGDWQTAMRLKVERGIPQG